ncbi:MAG TPA: chemotaxis protein CheW [Ignavibacteriales bacterium]|nr:chemotaxis protein CheW [Ignavibacteriales bacterium]
MNKSKIKQYLTMRFSGELFALDVAVIKNIINNADIHRPDIKAEFITGYVKLGHILVPLIDVKAKMGIQDRHCDDPCVIVAETQNDGRKNLFSFEADSIQDVLSVDAAEICPPDGGCALSGLLKGMAQSGFRLLKILDANKLCSEIELERFLEAS